MVFLPPAAIPPPIATLRAFELMGPRPGMQGAWEIPLCLQDTNYFQALKTFRMHDVNRDGHLDKTEFRKLMMSLTPGREDHGELEVLFRGVDLEGAGKIGFARFICWLFCDNGEELSSRRSSDAGSLGGRSRGFSPATPSNPPRRRSSSTTRLPRVNSAASLASLASRPSSPTQSDAGQDEDVQDRIVLKIVYEEEIKLLIGAVVRELQQAGRHIKVLARKHPRARGCDSVVARIGNGITLWDRGSMAAYFEYPFRTVPSALEWCHQLLKIHLPILIQTQRLAGRVAPEDDHFCKLDLL